MERLLAGKFAANGTVLRAAMAAFNVLRRIGQGAPAMADGVLVLRSEGYFAE